MLSAAASILLVPPVNLALLALAGAVLCWRRPQLGRVLALVCLLLLVAFALPVTAGTLLRSLDVPAPAVSVSAATPADQRPQAIIVLGGDVASLSGGRFDIGPMSLMRTRAGAALARQTGLPLLVTGGVVGQGGPPVAMLMAQSLAEDFAMPARWIEPRSHDTWENARFSAAMLHQAGIARVYVVTHPWHMRRALMAFRGTGLTVIPAPLPSGRPPLEWRDFVPVVPAWQSSFFALHEWIGCAGYALRRALG